MTKARMKFCCNDCDRGFTNREAWQHHGAQTGHDINGDIPSKPQQEVAELNAKLAKLQEAYKLVNEERARLATKLNAIISVINL